MKRGEKELDTSLELFGWAFKRLKRMGAAYCMLKRALTELVIQMNGFTERVQFLVISNHDMHSTSRKQVVIER
jgi:hypothetical protein